MAKFERVGRRPKLRPSILLTALVSIAAFGQTKPPQSTTQAEPHPTFVKVDSRRLMLDYASSSIGPGKYFGRWIAVSGGTITGVIPMKEPTPRCAVDLLIDEAIDACVVQSEAASAEQLHPGQRVVVACIAGLAGPNGGVYLDNCTVRADRTRTK